MSDIRFRVFDTIGKIELSYYDHADNMKRAVVSMFIPDEFLGRVAVAAARRAFHQNLMSEHHGNELMEGVRAFIPMPVFMVRRFDEETDEDGIVLGLFHNEEQAARAILKREGRVHSITNGQDIFLQSDVDQIVSDMGLQLGPDEGYNIGEWKVGELN